MRLLLIILLTVFSIAVAYSKTESNNLLGNWEMVSEDQYGIHTYGFSVHSLDYEPGDASLIYSGELTCSSVMRLVRETDTMLIFGGVRYADGFRKNGVYISPCNEVISQEGGFRGTRCSSQCTSELKNDEWKIVFYKRPQTIMALFSGEVVASGPANKMK